MGYVRKAAPYVCAVLKGMLFIGFSVQIVLGICWVWGNFGQVPSFAESESALYGGLVRLLGGKAGAVYCLQLAAAFSAGYLFLQALRLRETVFALWRALAFMTMPFAIQCHLSLQPFSLQGTLFLLLLWALLNIRKRRAAVPLVTALACAGVLAGLSGIMDPGREEIPGRSIEGALAARFAWPTLWNDYERYEPEMQIVPDSVLWESTFHPGDMRLFQESLESQVGVEKAKEFYLQMAKVGWEYHGPMIIRQMGWDVLGYAVTPVIFPLQMAGAAYDSYSGRNYEVMREHTPVLTRNYVDYGCWWFVWMLVISFFLGIAQLFCRGGARGGRNGKRAIGAAAVCCLASGLLVILLTMRGAGMMDYRQTIAVNELWLAGPLLIMGSGRCGGAGAGRETGGKE
ncbi:MAG: hypothetical protein HFH93_01500 [Lachnospiraceae bacterium]|nr:hypothetical protein [Lachnospiraceae bacterium]